MPCVRVGNAIVCGRGGGVKACVGCGKRNASRLCDARLKNKPGETCSAPICSTCTHRPAPEKDLCPTHARQYERLLRSTT